MFERSEFEASKRQNAKAMSEDTALHKLARDLLIASEKHNYAYQWTWLGLPIIQLPTDMVTVQELIWQNKPDVIIETGIAWGGSVVFYASILHLIGKGKVVAVDLNLMDHVTAQIMAYPFSNRIHLYKGSSTDPSTVEKVHRQIGPGQSVMLLLDSNHTHDHVLSELRLYAPMVTKGQSLIVCDTFVDDMPPSPNRPRPWGPGNNPKTALNAYLQESDRFVVDEQVDNKLLSSLYPGGYLRCVK